MNSVDSQAQKSDDLSLWKLFKSGSEVAFAEIYHLYVKGLIQYGAKISTNRQLVQDTIQDLFLELWNSRQRLSDTTSIKFYLFRALRNKLLRASTTQLSLSEFEGTISEPSIEFLIIEDESQEIRLSRLKSALLELTPRQQEAINLRYYHDFSNEDVAAMMGLNYQSACKLIYSGIKVLKENMATLVLLWSLIG